ncbi:MAG TPA: response regulator [bacterium]|nr:response regulator [bacterium]
MATLPEKAYCISCGEDVPVKAVSIGIEGEELLQCRHCLSFLGTASQPQTLLSPAAPPEEGVVSYLEAPGEFRPDETQAGGAILPDLPSEAGPTEPIADLYNEERSEPEEEKGLPLDTVITVEDSSLISAILNDVLVEQGLTRRVLAYKNGYEFLGRYIRERKKQTRIGLVFMDVKMPILNGISAAVGMRAHEKAQGLDPAPILFFTSKRCDDMFRKVLVHCAPAMYINKGTSTSPEHLQDRINKVIRQLLREQW